MEIIQYKEEYGLITYPDGFEALLDGLTIEEQKRYFRIGNGLYLKKPFVERRKNPYDKAINIEETDDVDAIVVKNGKIAGVIAYDEEIYKRIFIKPEGRYCCRNDSELDGSGYKSLVLYRYLICVSDQFEPEK